MKSVLPTPDIRFAICDRQTASSNYPPKKNFAIIKLVVTGIITPVMKTVTYVMKVITSVMKAKNRFFKVITTVMKIITSVMKTITPVTVLHFRTREQLFLTYKPFQAFKIIN
jgi:hypothetical protein